MYSQLIWSCVLPAGRGQRRVRPEGAEIEIEMHNAEALVQSTAYSRLHDMIARMRFKAHAMRYAPASLLMLNFAQRLRINGNRNPLIQPPLPLRRWYLHFHIHCFCSS